jgi:hypothetical protein
LSGPLSAVSAMICLKWGAVPNQRAFPAFPDVTIASAESKVQQEREMKSLSITYYENDELPPSPAEPTEPYVEGPPPKSIPLYEIREIEPPPLQRAFLQPVAARLSDIIPNLTSLSSLAGLLPSAGHAQSMQNLSLAQTNSLAQWLQQTQAQQQPVGDGGGVGKVPMAATMLTQLVAANPAITQSLLYSGTFGGASGCVSFVCFFILDSGVM